jgi:translocation protein SEC62
MLSKFAQGEKCLFPHRQAAIDFLDDMLNHKFFHRAKKVPVSEEELKGKSKKSKAADAPSEPKEKKETGTAEEAESSHAEGKVDKPVEKEKRKRKIRLEMHPQQLFVDGHEAYVWIYDPIPMHYWIFGTLLVIGAIVICLFPLWPPSLRKGVYYLSIAAAGFLVFILGLAVLRFVVFCIVWVFTGGKHHFWLLPNLTEDVGFVASFWPLYKHEVKETAGANKKSSKKRKRDKDSDAEDEKEVAQLEKEKIENIKEHDAEIEPETLLRQRVAAVTPTKKADGGEPVATSSNAVFTQATLNDSIDAADRKE